MRCGWRPFQAAQKLSLVETASALFGLAEDAKVAPSIRVASLQALSEFHDPRLLDAVRLAVTAGDEGVRKEGTLLQAEINPDEAVSTLSSVLENGTVAEKQGALAILGNLKGGGADKLLAERLDQLADGKVAREVQFDLMDAAAKRHSDVVKDKLKRYEASQPKDDEFAGYRETLYGGDASAGRRVFMDRPDAACVRCHKAGGQGGQVGPELTGIITPARSRLYFGIHFLPQ